MAGKLVRRSSHGLFFQVETESDVEATLMRLEFALSGIGLTIFQRTWTEPWLTRRAKERFIKEGDDAVGNWAPLQPATVAIRESLGYSGQHPINKRSGDLEDFIVNSNADAIVGPESSTLAFPGRSRLTPKIAEKLKTAQIGSEKPRTPPRPVLGLSVTDLMETEAALLLYITETVR